MSVRFILQDRDSQSFVNDKDEWVTNIRGARDFRHITEAMEFARTSDRPFLDLVMTFGDVKYDVRFPAKP